MPTREIKPPGTLPRTRRDSFDAGYLVAEHDIRTDLAAAIEQVYSEIKNEWLTEETRSAMHTLLSFARD